jgi:hypothetical protein
MASSTFAARAVTGNHVNKIVGHVPADMSGTPLTQAGSAQNAKSRGSKRNVYAASNGHVTMIGMCGKKDQGKRDDEELTPQEQNTTPYEQAAGDLPRPASVH